MNNYTYKDFTCSVREIAEKAGCNILTVWYWKKKMPESLYVKKGKRVLFKPESADFVKTRMRITGKKQSFSVYNDVDLVQLCYNIADKRRIRITQLWDEIFSGFIKMPVSVSNVKVRKKICHAVYLSDNLSDNLRQIYNDKYIYDLSFSAFIRGIICKYLSEKVPHKKS